MTNQSQTAISQEEAEDLLMDAVDNLAQVQENYDALTEDQQEMLKDSKSGIAAVYTHLDGPVVFDL